MDLGLALRESPKRSLAAGRNSRKALTIEISVSAVRPGRRQMPAQMSGRYFTPPRPARRRGRPCPGAARRLANSAAFGSWVTMITVLPCSRLSSWMRPRISSAVSRSRSPVGSSQTSRVGSATSARAMATRCCWPPESSAGLCLRRSVRPTSSSAAATFWRRWRAGEVGQQQRQLDVLLGRERRHQVVELEDEADVARSAICARSPLERSSMCSPPTVTSPSVGRSRPADQVQQGGLAGARRPHQRQELARRRCRGRGCAAPPPAGARACSASRRSAARPAPSGSLPSVLPFATFTAAPSFRWSAPSTATVSPGCRPATIIWPSALRSPSRTARRSALPSLITNTTRLAAVLGLHRVRRHEHRARAALACLARRRAQEGDVRAHLRHEARIAALDADPHRHRRLRAVGGGDHGDHLRPGSPSRDRRPA